MFDLIDNKIYNVGIYVRLSREDEDKDSNSIGESESIKNQKDFLTRYVLENNWNIVDIYSDDGYSGTSFDRPEFQRLIQDIEDKKINMVITKDLSRLGRDYIETGRYIEKYFPQHNIRFIAVNDGIDTFNNSSNNDMSPFKSVINDLYAKDISKKVKSVINDKRRKGHFIGAFAPYGYRKDSNDKGKLIIDNEVAHIVRRIFKMYINGHGYSYIANKLNKEGIVPPSAYKSSKSNYSHGRSKISLWSHNTVKRILTNPTYAGDLTQNRCRKINYKIKKLKLVPKDRWITIENTHEPIIDKDTFENIQKMIDKNASNEYTSKPHLHLLAGLIYCSDCGERMTFTKTRKGIFYCICSKYKRFKECTRHSIKEKDIESYVLADLKKISMYAVDRDQLLKIAQNKSNKNKISHIEVEERNINGRLLKIKKILKNLYEDKVEGVITQNQFIELSQGYTKEKENLKKRLKEIEEKKAKLEKETKDTNNLTKLIKDFSSFKVVDKAMLSKLIEKINIFEDNRISIYYTFKNPF